MAVRRTGGLGCQRAEECRIAVLATLGCTDSERGSVTVEKNGARQTALDSGTRSSSAKGEVKREMSDDTVGFGQTGKRTKSWRCVTPDKWAQHKRKFPGFKLKPHFGSRLQ
jgi:hypothetical protein